MENNGTFFIKHNIFFEKKDILEREEDPSACPVDVFILGGVCSESILLHRNRGIKVIYSRNKRMIVNIDGEKHVLCPGGFLLIGNNALYSAVLELSDVPQDVMVICYRPYYLKRMCPLLFEHEISGDMPEGTASRESMAVLCECLRVCAEEQPENEGRRFEIDQLLFAILQTIFHDFQTEPRKTGVRRYETRNKMAEVVDYLWAHYRENLTTKSVADHFWYNREYFCRLFKRYANQTFREYMMELRMIAEDQKKKDTEES